MLGGIVCDNTNKIRRVSFVGFPAPDFDGMGMNVLPWDDSITSPMSKDELDAYVAAKSNWDSWGFKIK